MSEVYHHTHAFESKERLLWSGVLLLGGLILFSQAAQRLAPGSTPAPDESVVYTWQATDPVPLPEAPPVNRAGSLIEAIVQVESGGDPRCVGGAGERGLMQLKRATWEQVGPEAFGRVLSFDDAFDPSLNRLAGRAYLAWLQRFLHRHEAGWQADERSLLLAAYNAGPGAVQRAGFDPRRLPPSTQDYIRRVSALQDSWTRADRQVAATW